MTIKCGRHEYELENGDYIMDNGACLQYCPKDKTRRPMKGCFSYLPRVSKKEFNRIKTLPNIIIQKSKRYSYITYYTWNEQ